MKERNTHSRDPPPYTYAVYSPECKSGFPLASCHMWKSLGILLPLLSKEGVVLPTQYYVDIMCMHVRKFRTY